MKKLIKGIVDFRKTALTNYREKFGGLALGQSPDTLFIACSDSRVVPNVFASTDPGDLFVVRNVGNLIPNCGKNERTSEEGSAEAAAIEFAVVNLKVSDIVVCGHSECGAMVSLMEGREKILTANVRDWLRHGEPSLERLSHTPIDQNQKRPNQLSQLNVLQQLEHLRSYSIIREHLVDGHLKLHGWWFELSTANVYAYEESADKFVLIDEEEAARIQARISG